MAFLHRFYCIIKLYHFGDRSFFPGTTYLKNTFDPQLIIATFHYTNTFSNCSFLVVFLSNKQNKTEQISMNLEHFDRFCLSSCKKNVSLALCMLGNFACFSIGPVEQKKI